MARTIKADGKTIVVPDDATDDEINQLVGPAPKPSQSSTLSTDPSGRTPTGAPALGDKRNWLQRGLDNMTTPDPRKEEWQGGIKTGLDRFAQGSGSAFLPILSHPLDSVVGAARSIGHAAMNSGGSAQGFANELMRPMIDSTVKDFQENGAGKALPSLLGKIAGGAATGELTGAALPKVAQAGSALRTAAIGDPDAAALSALRVGSGSKKGLGTLKAVEGSRPYLKGSTDLEDLQSKVPAAKKEIWGPYQSTIEQIGDNPVQGPNGVSTVRELESERQQLSALNRGLKSQNPEAIQLAQQKGMTQAQLLQAEKDVQAALDPHLAAAGIDPGLIRKTFGQVAQVGEKVSGRTTLPEKAKPYGFGKMLSSNPFTSAPGETIGNLASGTRDLAAGRPWWSGKPTDVAIKDAFRLGGEKPDFRAPLSAMPSFQKATLGLPSSVIANGDIADDLPQLGNGFERSSNARTGNPPPSRLALPSIAGEGELQPMVGVLKHPGEQRSFTPETTRISPANNGKPGPVPGGRYAVGPDGQIQKIPARLGGNIGTPTIEGEKFYTGEMETPMYPAASSFRGPKPKAWTADELKVLNALKPLVPER